MHPIFLILMLLFFLALPVRADPSYGGPMIPSCIEQDYVVIKDDGPGKAIVTYSNSKESCSDNLLITLTSPNGIEVDIEITIGGIDEEYKEVIILRPTDPNMMAFPPEDELEDGVKKNFVIMGGMS